MLISTDSDQLISAISLSSVDFHISSKRSNPLYERYVSTPRLRSAFYNLPGQRVEVQLFVRLATYLQFAVKYDMLDFAARLLDRLVCFPTHLYDYVPELFAALQSLGCPTVMQKFMCAAANRVKSRVSYGPVQRVFGNLASRGEHGGELFALDSPAT